MKSEEDFDNLLREKFSPSNFPFEEDKWARMEELLIAKENARKKRRFLLFYFYGFLTALLILTPIFWYTFSKSDRKNQHNLSQDKLPNQFRNNTTDNDPQDYLSPAKSNQQTSETIPKKNQIFKENETVSKKRFTHSNKTKKHSIKTFKTQNNTKIATVLIDKTHSFEEIKNVIRHTESNKYEENQKDTLTLIDVLKDSLINASESNHDLKDSSAFTDYDVKQNDTLTNLSNKMHYFVSLGGMYHVGFSKDDASGFNPILNFGVNLPFKSNWSICSGIAYFQVNHINFNKTFTERSYDFGYRDKVTEIEQKKLHYLSFPIYLENTVNRFSYSFGLNPSILIANKTEITNYERSSLMESSKLIKSSYRMGHGLNSFDLLTSIGIKMKLNTKLFISTQFCFGFMDVRKNNFTLVNKTERNRFLTLQLIYILK